MLLLQMNIHSEGGLVTVDGLGEPLLFFLIFFLESPMLLQVGDLGTNG